ncbi:MerR family transcriptional regulator [Sphingomonas spermidinifaciens]|uniref:MerR family transcriptional regulator n=1 Tax=Sphingomonas spermidinifaciens TaxID=1141889 RepID=A0A2A4B5R3_9SPHN|nr:helix-turn-helix domain-containing protein [Sphingomonas spermidinifaciens]PCD03781.1 MerR family transcriptional regulator [Sphingomonas spermidinifaciens]
MKIGDIANRTGLKVETIRFYEREGLIDAPRRSDGNYRLYNHSHLDRLSFVKRSRDLGFTLDQVRDLLRLAENTRNSCDEVDEIVAVHIREIDRKLGDLAALRDEVVRWGGGCDANTIANCKVIDALSSGLPGQRADAIT